MFKKKEQILSILPNKKLSSRNVCTCVTFILLKCIGTSFKNFFSSNFISVQTVNVNYKSAVRQDAEFILSCAAQGSPKMVFRWYKNGAYVNTTKATR